MISKRILVLAANPKNTDFLDLEREVREITAGLQRSTHRADFELVPKWAVRPIDIRRAMLDVTPNIVHFSGHGAGESGLKFEDENGNSKIVSGSAFGELLGLFDKNIQRIECILLNSCYSETLAESIKQHFSDVEVVGTKATISSDVAINYAVGFYDALGAGHPIDFADRLGHNSVNLESSPVTLDKNNAALQPSFVNIVILNCPSRINSRDEGLTEISDQIHALKRLKLYSRIDIPINGDEVKFFREKIEESQLILILVSVELIACFNTRNPSDSQKVIRALALDLTNNKEKIVPISYSTNDFEDCELFCDYPMKLPSNSTIIDTKFSPEKQWDEVRAAIRNYINQHR
jgi:hypothetical protein